MKMGLNIDGPGGAPRAADQSADRAFSLSRGAQLRFKSYLARKKEEPMRRGFRSWKSLLSAAVVGALAFVGTAQANSTWYANFHTAYPAAVGSRIDSCLLCHTTASASPSTRNVYGTAYGNASHNFTTIANLDSDADGFSNATEITQFFFPGNAADHPAGTVLPTVTIAATDAIATEAGLTTGQYTVTRTGATTAALTVSYAVTGTATAGSDYAALTGSVQIPVGAASATITVTPIDDLLVEPDETVIATLGANAAYTVGAASSATVTIQSNDVALPTVTIAATDAIATEAGLTTGQYTVTRTGATTAALTVNYTVGGTATAGSDYVTLPGSVQIPAGATSATITVTPIDDTAVEPAETVVVTLGANAAYTLGAAASATVTIQSNDVVAAVTLTVASTNPANGILIAVSPADRNNAGAGTTQFTRTYDQGTEVTLTAATGFGVPRLVDWTGCTSVAGAVCTVTLDASTTVTANFSTSTAYVLWSRGDLGKASLWQIDPSQAAGDPPVVPFVNAAFLQRASGIGKGWEATSYQQVGPTEGYVLWTRNDMGKAALWKIDPSQAAGSPLVIPKVEGAYLHSAAGVAKGWRATCYQHVGPTEGYVLWTRNDTGAAVLWKIDPSQMVGTPAVIPLISSSFLYSAAGVGAPWEATGYHHVSATEGYILWTRSDTGQAALWQIDPSAGGKVIPVTQYLYSSPALGAPWKATGYQHVSATEGYILWTRNDTGQGSVWKIDPSSGPSFGRQQPVADTMFLQRAGGLGAPWSANSYVLGGAQQ
jgi:hypothetical protein